MQRLPRNLSGNDVTNYITLSDLAFMRSTNCVFCSNWARLMFRRANSWTCSNFWKHTKTNYWIIKIRRWERDATCLRLVLENKPFFEGYYSITFLESWHSGKNVGSSINVFLTSLHRAWIKAASHWSMRRLFNEVTVVDGYFRIAEITQPWGFPYLHSKLVTSTSRTWTCLSRTDVLPTYNSLLGLHPLLSDPSSFAGL